MSKEKGVRKSERSHEENQERAYIAASRRTDRSLEARVQSARMASEIHKKRTGKGFRITEAIVLKEEMYEEEDCDLPRFAVLGLPGHPGSVTDPQTGDSTSMSDLLASSHQIWRQNEVNTMFDRMFPHANEHARRMSQQGSPPLPYVTQTPQYLPQVSYTDFNTLPAMPQPIPSAVPPPMDNSFGVFDFSPATPEGDQSLSSVSSPSLAEYMFLDPSQLQQQDPTQSPWL
ncbi:hypothetical protein TARUN_3955 [Trichoderma arundinaceum]|uniref:Uncharacterized protein n=1 Tax=Trichoderma arundinaceum TaxID=490622 RepID=A0A395NR15_TRIAR|nr:hypothetical protein TARUN_3955 [Trichoderma arundinaceum]